jgi:transposase-like protein
VVFIWLLQIYKQLRQIIRENGIQNVGDIYNILKVSFKEMMQKMLEAEMKGYPKNQKDEQVIDNKRNSYSPKTVKNLYG